MEIVLKVLFNTLIQAICYKYVWFPILNKYQIEN